MLSVLLLLLLLGEGYGATPTTSPTISLPPSQLTNTTNLRTPSLTLPSRTVTLRTPTVTPPPTRTVTLRTPTVTPPPTPTPTLRTPTQTPSPSATLSLSRTVTSSLTRSLSLSGTVTPTLSDTLSISSTFTLSITFTLTASATFTLTGSKTLSTTLSGTLWANDTYFPSDTVPERQNASLGILTCFDLASGRGGTRDSPLCEGTPSTHFLVWHTGSNSPAVIRTEGLRLCKRGLPPRTLDEMPGNPTCDWVEEVNCTTTPCGFYVAQGGNIFKVLITGKERLHQMKPVLDFTYAKATADKQDVLPISIIVVICLCALVIIGCGLKYLRRVYFSVKERATPSDEVMRTTKEPPDLLRSLQDYEMTTYETRP